MERSSVPAGVDPAFFDAEIDRALAPYASLVSAEDLAFMRERLAASITEGALRVAARRAAPRIVEESIEAPLSPEDAAFLRQSPTKKETGSGG